MKKLFFLLLALFAVSSQAMAEESMCYTHAKSWHPCPIQPSSGANQR